MVIALATLTFKFITIFTLLTIAYFIYALYQEPEMINAFYCKFSTEHDLTYTACMLIKNAEL